MYSYTLEKKLFPEEKLDGYYGVIYACQEAENSEIIKQHGIIAITDLRMIFEDDDKKLYEIHNISDIDVVSRMSSVHAPGVLRIRFKDTEKSVYLTPSNTGRICIIRFFNNNGKCTLAPH